MSSRYDVNNNVVSYNIAYNVHLETWYIYVDVCSVILMLYFLTNEEKKKLINLGIESRGLISFVNIHPTPLQTILNNINFVKMANRQKINFFIKEKKYPAVYRVRLCIVKDITIKHPHF